MAGSMPAGSGPIGNPIMPPTYYIAYVSIRQHTSAYVSIRQYVPDPCLRQRPHRKPHHAPYILRCNISSGLKEFYYI
jgi:hypothetical protein